MLDINEKCYMILDEDKNLIPATVLEWGRFLEIPSNKIVKRDMVDQAVISTVLLGVDLGFDGTPLWFETMVFPSENNFSEQYCKRYSTYDEALKGHAETVRMVENGEILISDEGND